MEGWAARHGLSTRFDDSFTYLARLATAAVAPDRLSELRMPPEYSAVRSALNECRVMKQHGHDEYLRTYLIGSEDLRNVSIEGLWSLLGETKDQDEQQWLIRRAIQVWRIQTDMARRPWEVEQIFLSLFRDYWPVLPRTEAADLVS
jgi:hypothetical protein